MESLRKSLADSEDSLSQFKKSLVAHDRDLLTMQITELRKQLDVKEAQRASNLLLEKQFTQCLEAIPDPTLLSLIKKMKEMLKCDYAQTQLKTIKNRLE